MHPCRSPAFLEHKHFDMNLKEPVTLVTHAYPQAWTKGDIEYYPVNRQRRQRSAVHTLSR